MSGFSRSGFLQVVANAPLVSIDLVVVDADRRMLMGWRVNEPARNSWFVPGGRIWRGETLEQAFARIASAELGPGEWDIADARLLGLYTHIYPTNFSGVEGIGTHYVVLAHLVEVLERPVPPDEQHSDFVWLAAGEVPPHGEIHPNTAVYFQELDAALPS